MKKIFRTLNWQKLIQACKFSTNAPIEKQNFDRLPFLKSRNTDKITLMKFGFLLNKISVNSINSLIEGQSMLSSVD